MTNHPFDPLRLQDRAQNLFARAARIQDLHGQAQAACLARKGASITVPESNAERSGSVPELLENSARHELESVHRTLMDAAEMAAMLTSTDAEISRLTESIFGCGTNLQRQTRNAEVVEVKSREVRSIDDVPRQLSAPPPFKEQP